MPELNRRRFLQIAGATAGISALSGSIARAASIPAQRSSGSIQDVEHVVVLMQENRSFDHYFGAMKGVRGFGDPRPVTLNSGKSVWHQPDGGKDVLPYHPDAENLGMQFIEGLNHDWAGGHKAWNDGKYDQWIAAKGTGTMAHLDAEGHPLPLRARRRVHRLRLLPLLADRGHRPQPLLHVLRPRRQRRQGRRPGPRQRGGRIRLDDLPGAAGAGRDLLEALPGHR